LKVHGYAAQQAKAPLKPYSFERREPGNNDVVIDIQYCGICHTDIHQVNDEWGGSTYPMVPGHEIVGIVKEVGPKVTRYSVDDRVGVGCFVDSCRKCSSCVKGLEQYCIEGPTLTYNGLESDAQTRTKGGYSDKIVVDENYVLRIPDDLQMDRTAPLLCAGITMYSPLMHWNAGPGKRVGIVGLGGLGHMGVKFAHALGAEVTVLSHSLRKQDEAKKMGADKFYAAAASSSSSSSSSSLNSQESFQDLEGYFDLIINTLSVEIDWNLYLNLLALDGTMVVVGLPEKDNPLSASSLIDARRSLAGSVIGGIRETQEMLNFCSKQNIACDIELIPIQKVNESYLRVVNSDVRYRFVIDSKSID
jgi:alcohol dehydrogenase (NADP+)